MSSAICNEDLHQRDTLHKLSGKLYTNSQRTISRLIKHAMQATILGCIGFPDTPGFNQIISNSHRTFAYLSIQNPSCDTNEWLIVDFVSPKAYDFSSNCTFRSTPLGTSLRFPAIFMRRVERREGKEKGENREGKERDTPSLL